MHCIYLLRIIFEAVGRAAHKNNRGHVMTVSYYGGIEHAMFGGSGARHRALLPAVNAAMVFDTWYSQ